MAQEIELGLDTFGDVTVGPDGRELPYAEVIRNVVAEGVLADQVGVDFIGLGEHHRDDYAISAPEVALAAIAARTERIRLGSAVTVLSSDDPVRVFQRFATLDAVSEGRAEVILGRGSFTESFPLFGYELSDYERLFEEKLGLFAELVKESPVTWSGSTRAPLTDHDVFPKTTAGHLKTWIGVGGSPESVVRAARHGMPLMLAIIGGEPHRFAPYADLFARALDQLEQPSLPVGIHSPGYVGETDAEAREAFFPDYQVMHARIGKDRGWPPLARASYEQEIEHGSLYVGSAETVARKIAATLKAVGATRFDLKYSAGPFSHERMMGGIERYGTVVAPMVRDILA
ncbi:LLM class flavin-dependent oxidoreductase [Clavibacter sp. MX14-G9D]|uniref:LLM class flavin-dependent oxidoreductase n=1 Tax=Clavibacter sp. MX14-G9D TaxID=3064656 RepID=UPI00293EA366|nr:LLM class flavin-dependent oxidoreductase [Clavibacter sp. MX14-G9D]